MPESLKGQKEVSLVEELKALSEEQKKKLLEKSEISLLLDSYEDMFSDFDPRDYHKKALSQDFLDEAKRASIDKDFDGIELHLLVPMHKRSAAHENTIKRRLHEHFRKHHDILAKESKSTISKGALFVITGIILMFTAALFLYKNHSGLWASFLIILLEPGGWFFFWEGLNLVVFESKKKSLDLDFYRKMSQSNIIFGSY